MVGDLTGYGTLIVAGFVGVMIWRQTKAAEATVTLETMKRRHELFDKRFPIYQAARTFLSNVLQEGKVDLQELEKYRLQILDAGFLFDNEISDYLFELRKKALGANLKLTQNDHQTHSELISELVDELLKGGLYEKFRPFMRWE